MKQPKLALGLVGLLIALVYAFRVDYYLGLGQDCERRLSKPVLYRNALERTCVVALSASAGH